MAWTTWSDACLLEQITYVILILAGNRLKIRVCVGIEINLTLVSLESACELKKKHSSCHRAKFHEIELFPFISRFFKKITLQIQKGPSSIS